MNERSTCIFWWKYALKLQKKILKIKIIVINLIYELIAKKYKIDMYTRKEGMSVSKSTTVEYFY